MLALILWYTLGWRAGATEMFVELAIGLLIYGGGGGKRIRATLRDLDWRPRRRRAALLPGLRAVRV